VRLVGVACPMGGAPPKPATDGLAPPLLSGVLEAIPVEVGEGLEVRARIAGQRPLREMDDTRPRALGETHSSLAVAMIATNVRAGGELARGP